ncbi:MAG: hypothetical protein V7723_13200 [Sneathiella sp.]|uniref:hypothetical protein n=1 Tax=Sneathiella sp. TaxID=1964365 RepID=UPI00300385F0
MKGTYSDFLSSLLAFESGWDRERFDSGNIQSFQLDQWAGGTVDSFFPNYDSWSNLTDDEWTMMAYRSTNSLGFVGFQFGEALLIDLGYYDDDFFYGSGASSNTWDGSWTGKNGANSLEDFMTQDVQDIAIQDAFGHNLEIIQNGLAAQGKTLEQFIGQTGSYTQNGQEVSVELTLTGILAAAHLRGAYGLLDLLQGGAVSSDEFGTSILQYIEEFGGFDAPMASELIADYRAGKTGDEGLGTPDGTSTSPGGSPNGDANTSSGDADVAIDWDYGSNPVYDNFNPATDTIFIAWFTAEHIEIAETNGSVVISIPSNNQTATLTGITLGDLSADNFTFKDSTAAEKILAFVGSGNEEPLPPQEENLEPDTPDNPDANEHPMADSAIMHQITLTSPSKTIDDFDPARDMFHIEAGITDDLLEIKEISTTNSTNVVLTIFGANSIVISTIIVESLSISDLSLANFAISDASALNEIASVLGQAISTPVDGGMFNIVYDNDGSNPASESSTGNNEGVIFKADFYADDITGFNLNTDQIDFGDISVHGLITNKSPSGELIIDNPWGPDMQILQDVQFSDLTTENFGIVGNEHLRQDIGGVLSWELDVGPRDANAVYIRSHEYGVHEQIDGFDPSTMKISFLYYGTRERLSVEDSNEGLVISTLPSGQSMTFTGVELADLQPGTLEFHHDQVMEDRLEEPFGFSQDDVTLVSREQLLTPDAPAGATTDGFQIRRGDLVSENEDTSLPDDVEGSPPDPTPMPDPEPNPKDENNNVVEQGDGVDVHLLTWKWSAIDVLSNFNASEDILDFGSLSVNDVSISKANNDLLIEIVNNGGHTYVLENTQAEDLSAANFTAGNWNGVLEEENGVFDQLIGLGSSNDSFS